MKQELKYLRAELYMWKLIVVFVIISFLVLAPIVFKLKLGWESNKILYGVSVKQKETGQIIIPGSLGKNVRSIPILDACKIIEDQANETRHQEIVENLTNKYKTSFNGSN